MEKEKSTKGQWGTGGEGNILPIKKIQHKQKREESIKKERNFEGDVRRTCF